MAHKTQVEINGEMTEVFEFDHSAQEIDDAVEQVLNGGGGSGGESGAAVLYTAQSLTTSQQQQARQNIGAVSTADFNAALGEVNAALAAMDEVIG